MHIMTRLWADETATIVSAELLLIMTIVGIGMIVGLTTYRDQIVFEFADLATALGQFNQSYSFGAITGNMSSIAGSVYVDNSDFCTDTSSSMSDPADAGTACVAVIPADTAEI